MTEHVLGVIDRDDDNYEVLKLNHKQNKTCADFNSCKENKHLLP